MFSLPNRVLHHTGTISQVFFSCDGQYVVGQSPGSTDFSTDDGYEHIVVWQRETGRIVTRFEVHPSRNIAVSPTRNVLIVGCGELRDLTTGELLRRFLKRGEWPPDFFAFSPDGETVAMPRQAIIVDLLDVATGECRYRLYSPNDGYDRGPLQFLADDRFAMYKELYDGFARLCLWTPDQSNRAFLFRRDEEGQNRIAVSPTGRTLVSATHPCHEHQAGPVVTLWRLVVAGDGLPMKWDVERALPAQAGDIDTLLFSPDGGTILISGRETIPPDDAPADVLPVSSLRFLDRIEGAIHEVRFDGVGGCPCFSPDGNLVAMLIAAAKDKWHQRGEFRLILWDADSAEERASITFQYPDNTYGYFPCGFTFSPDGKQIGVPLDHAIAIWDIDTLLATSSPPGR